MQSQTEIIEKLKEIKPNLERDFEVKSIGIFGSYAQNKQTETSDIDILVELKKPIGWKFFALESYLQAALNTKVDLVTPGALKKQLKESILSDVRFA